MTSLYRKYRPITFAEMFGQGHIVKTLSNQIAQDALTHAYLFCGTRGTGKTTSAKIVARAINCESRVDGIEPCNVCASCEAIFKNRSTNVIEIDAASNNGVDNIRDIIEEVKYPPTEGKYKVYIIDEIHMLSIGAFNALLKTLEEPPQHVIFILATTDPHKVPATIHSRVQRFDFRRVEVKEIADNLAVYATKENITIDEPARLFIAKMAEGSVRDALSLFGQVIAFYGQEAITEADVRQLIGAVDTSVLFELTEAIINQSVGEAMGIIQTINDQGRDLVSLVGEMVGYLRNLMVAKYTKDSHQLLLSSEQMNQLMGQGQRLTDAEITRMLDMMIELASKMRYEKSQRVLLEVTVMRLCVGGLGLAETVVQREVPKRASKPKAPVVEAVPSKSAVPSQPVLNTGEVTAQMWQDYINTQEMLIKNLLKTCEITSHGGIIYIHATDINYNLLKVKEPQIVTSLKAHLQTSLDVQLVQKNLELKSQMPKGLTKEQKQDLKQKINMDIEGLE